MLFVTLALGLGVVTSCNKKSEKVPAAVKQTFETAYPGTEVKWGEEDGNYEAEFKSNNQEMSAVYNAAGVLQETELEMKVTELPDTITKYVAANKMGDIKEAAKITKADGTVMYEAEINGKDVMFTETGALIPQTEKAEKAEKADKEDKEDKD